MGAAWKELGGKVRQKRVSIFTLTKLGDSTWKSDRSKAVWKIRISGETYGTHPAMRVRMERKARVWSSQSNKRKRID